jgi:hypothetical protein
LLGEGQVPPAALEATFRFPLVLVTPVKLSLTCCLAVTEKQRGRGGKWGGGGARADITVRLVFINYGSWTRLFKRVREKELFIFLNFFPRLNALRDLFSVRSLASGRFILYANGQSMLFFFFYAAND